VRAAVVALVLAANVEALTLGRSMGRVRGGVRMQMEGRMDRRAAIGTAAAGILLGTSSPARAQAIDKKGKVVVVGATGQTGRRVFDDLVAVPGLTTVAGVRDSAKAEKSLGAGIATVKMDVSKDSTDDLATALRGADAVVCAVGFVPGNPFQMNKEAKAVDNEGTCRLIDAAVKAGCSKFVLVSSILTDGRSWGQEKSPGFTITNAFGGVLDEKIVAERYLRRSGLDYTIVRPGGLRADPPAGNLVVRGENTLNSGEVSRDLVAQVCVSALFNPKASDRVVEIIEEDGAPALPEEKWF